VEGGKGEATETKCVRALEERREKSEDRRGRE
jgi:hypothetical protein